MWKELFDIVPRPLALAVFCYGAMSWFVTGPIVAERTVETRYYPACVAGMTVTPLPENPEARLLDEFANSPLFQDPLMKSLGMDRYLNSIRRWKQTEREAALAARPEPAVHCRCLIGKAIAKSHTAWVLYAGSLRLIAWPEVARFDGVMAQIEREGGCNG
jgi:hypothetical protein